MRVPLRIIGQKTKTTWAVEANPDDTVATLKNKVRDLLKSQMGTDHLQLIYGGEWLDDKRTLTEAGINGQFFVGVEIIPRDQAGRSFTVPRGGTLKHSPVRSVSMEESVCADVQEPMMEDDLFESFRYLMTKYYRYGTRKAPPSELKGYHMRWSMTADEMNDVDILVEMGFQRPAALQVYMACEKRLGPAADFLLREGSDW